MPKVTVFTKENCVQCNMTKKALDRIAVEYEQVDVTKDPSVIEELKASGHMSAPVVKVEYSDHVNMWAGFRPELLLSI